MVPEGAGASGSRSPVGDGTPGAPESRPGAGSGADASARLDRQPVHDGRIVHLTVDRVRFPDGTTGELELVQHAGAAAVLPVLGDPGAGDPEILLIRQYRYAGGGPMLEVPAGMPEDEDDTWVDCARRELEEETGYLADDLRYLTRVHTTPGFCDEVIHLFLATGLKEGDPDRDLDEFIDLARMPLSRALDLARTGEITDGKTLVSLLHAATFLLGTPPLPD